MIHTGIDISKKTLDVHLNKKHKQWSNSQKGIEGLIRQLPKDAYVIFEASGAYTKLLYKMLSDAGIATCCANPLQVRRFAQAFGKVAKTDKIDGQTLAEYGEHVNPKPTHFMNDVQLRLVELMYVRETALKDYQAAKNRLEMPICAKDVLKMQKAIVQSRLKELNRVNDAIDKFMKDNAEYEREVILSWLIFTGI